MTTNDDPRSADDTIPLSDSALDGHLENILTISVGSLLLNRFRIARFIARGGMGEVYEAEDLDLHERVALKTITPGRAGEPLALERLRREVQIARRITHPNVCRTYDVFTCAHAGHDITFVTMELLGGQTLSEILRQQTRLELADAEDIAEQVGSGLQAAHAAGIIHRDLKSNNIIIVTQDAGRMRAVVTDFGIAARIATTGTTITFASDSHRFAGTPAYMAPEQVTGEQPTERTDIYAFGVVLYEMVSGGLPFTADTPLALALKRLSGAPEDLRARRPELPDRWHRSVMRCLARDPGDRFASVGDVLRSLTDDQVSVRRVNLPAILAIIAVLGVGGVVHLAINRPPPTETKPGLAERRSLALLGFRNISQESKQDYISTILSEGIATELASVQTLRTIPGESVARMKIELGLGYAETLAAETLKRVRANVSADLVILGAYLVETPKMSLFVRVQDARTGEIISSFTHTGADQDLIGLVAAAAATLRAQLSKGGAAPGAPVHPSLPSNSTAQRLYAEGLDALRRFDAKRARDLLEQLTAQESQSPLAHSALAAAWADLGYDAQAARSAETALQLAGALPPSQKGWIEAQAAEASKRWDSAVVIYERLLAEDPGNRDYGIRLASAQVAAGRPADARRTVERLRRVEASPDARVLLAEAIAAGSAGDYRAQQLSAKAAAEAAAGQGSPLLVARALIDEAGAWLRLGNRAQAENASAQALRLYMEAGDRRGVARANIQLGNIYRSQKKAAEAEICLQRAVDVARDLGNKSLAARAVNDLAAIYYERADYQVAGKMYEEVLKISREVGDKYTEGRALSNLASSRYAAGRVGEAKVLDEQALSIQRTLGNPATIASSLLNIAETALETGEPGRAEKMCREALAINRELRNEEEEAYALAGLSRVLTYRGQLTEAQAAADAALGIRRRLGDESQLAESLFVSAFAFAGVDSTKSVEWLRQILSNAAVEQDLRMRAASLLLHLRLDEGEIVDAGQVSSLYLSDGLSEERQGVRLTVEVALARLAAAQQRSDWAAKKLRNVASTAARSELRLYALEASFELARVLMVNAPNRSIQDLISVEEQARKLGFERLVRQAEALRQVARSKLGG